MSDQYIETQTTSWGQRLMWAMAGILIGLVLLIVAFPLLWWNEGRSLHRATALDQGRRLVVEATADAVNPANQGKLLHVSGGLTTADTLDDPTFGVHEQALKLRRVVEMYQWQESQSSQSKANLGGGHTTQTTYTYNKVWSSTRYDSSGFKQPQEHENPAAMPYPSQDFPASIHLGAFRLSNDFVGQITTYDAYPLTDGNYAAMDAGLRTQFQLHEGHYYVGDPANPQVGATRISYQIIRPRPASVVGAQSGDMIVPFDTTGGRSASRSSAIALIRMGDADANAMFASARDQNELVAWGVRVGGLILMRIGMYLIARPLVVLADVVPLLGRLAAVSNFLVTGLAALTLSLCTVAAAWIYYRPLLGAALLVVAAGSLYGIVHQVRRAKVRVAAS
jgi:hypothetical protein